MNPLYVVKKYGDTFSVMEVDASIKKEWPVLHNLAEWQALSIAAILNGG